MAKRLLPADLLHFIELRQFSRRWAALGLNDEADLWALQDLIMSNPMGGSVVSGTTGIRKLRFAPPTWDTGKRGATRVLYVILPNVHVALLCVIYAKNELGTISQAGKKSLNALVSEIIAEHDRKRP